MIKSALYNLVFLFSISFFVSCSSEDTTENSIIGTWELTSYSVGLEVDINNDEVANMNLLNEMDCDYNETLGFDTGSLMTHQIDYMPTFKVHKIEDRDYVFDVTCDEGIISTAGTYSLEDLNESYIITDTTITHILENAIQVYDEDQTAVIETLTVTKTYAKQ